MPITALAATEPPEPQRIVEVVGQYTVLRPLGETQLQGSCPFCGSTAFRVRLAFGTFHCLGCGYGGDALCSPLESATVGDHASTFVAVDQEGSLRFRAHKSRP
jgi:hypothetical protein